MYILDTGNFRVVKWLPNQPLGFTVAGGRGSGNTLDSFSTSYALFLDRDSSIYISDFTNNRITMWLQGNTTTGLLVRISFCLLITVSLLLL